MVHEVYMGKKKRMSFSRINEVLDMPDLIEVQKNSYQRFVEEDLKEVLDDISPITDYSEKLVLEFVDYSIDFDHPKYSVEECKERDVNYCAPLRVTVRLINKETGEVKEQPVFMGDFPLMTEQGTFIINGAERVIVSQLVRSPGVYYSESIDKVGKHLFASQVIPNRGAWLEYETDSNEIMYVKIDRQRKVFITALLRALGYSSDGEILELLGEDERLKITLEKDTTKNTEEGLIEIYKRQRPGEPPTEESARSLLNALFFDKRYDLARVGRYKFNKKLSIASRLHGLTAAENVIAPGTGEILATEGEVISREAAEAIENAGVHGVYVIAPDGARVKILGNLFVDARCYLKFDPEEAGLNEKVHYPTFMKLLEEAGDMEEEELKKFLKARVYDLIPRHIITDDITASISYLLGMSHGIGRTDDIDHLGNRRIRSVGELLQNQIRVGMTRLERVVRERMSIQDTETAMPSNLINIRPVTAAIKEFFGSSQLSQFMDQTNPLAELTHKRRLSALGPGGLNRERATFEVRDVHYSHYGRMCPIETPEGPNIGLINSLSTYARINRYGFIEAPYRKVDGKNKSISDEIVYLTADEEDDYIVAQANEPTVTDENGRVWFAKDRVVARRLDEIIEVKATETDYMDVSPKQLVSVATAMIPFLENDDANRALMGSNMQRQAVPLLKPEAPVVGTGMEYKAAHDSGVVVLSRQHGVVKRVDASHIVIAGDDGNDRTYNIIKFKRSNQGTCIEDTGNEPTYEKKGFLEMGVSPIDAPDKPTYITLEFDKGVPVALDGEKMSAKDIILKLNELGGANGIGIIDIVENRLIGMKCRGVYETPGGTILYKAHSVLESVCLDKMTLHEKQKLSITFAELVYNGQWFTPLREALSAFVDKTQEKVSGTVKLKLYKGNMINAGVWSPNSLYSEEIATFGESDYDQAQAKGFIDLYGLPIKVQAMVDAKNAKQN